MADAAAQTEVIGRREERRGRGALLSSNFGVERQPGSGERSRRLAGTDLKKLTRTACRGTYLTEAGESQRSEQVVVPIEAAPERAKGLPWRAVYYQPQIHQDADCDLMLPLHLRRASEILASQ